MAPPPASASITVASGTLFPFGKAVQDLNVKDTQETCVS